MGLRGRSKSSSFQFSPQKKRHVHLFGTNWNAQTRQGSLWTFLKGEISRCRTCGRMSYHQTEVQLQSEMAAGEGFTDSPKKGVKVIGSVVFFDVTLKNFCEAKALVLFIVAIHNYHNCKISMKSLVWHWCCSFQINESNQTTQRKKADDCYFWSRLVSVSTTKVSLFLPCVLQPFGSAEKRLLPQLLANKMFF